MSALYTWVLGPIQFISAAFIRIETVDYNSQ